MLIKLTLYLSKRSYSVKVQKALSILLSIESLVIFMKSFVITLVCILLLINSEKLERQRHISILRRITPVLFISHTPGMGDHF